MFQITRRADYAVRIILELSGLPAGGRLQVQPLAERTGVPVAFFHKITGDLVKAGLVRTFSGPKGGLELARPAAEINLFHIVEAIEGPICLNACLLHIHECPRDTYCPVHTVWGRVQASLIQQLQSITMAQLAVEGHALRHIEVILPETIRVD